MKSEKLAKEKYPDGTPYNGFRREAFIAGYRAALQNAVDVSAEDLIQKIKNKVLSAYYAGFNQAHYSSLHPETFQVKECQSAGEEYLAKEEKWIEKDLHEYASTKSKGAVSDAASNWTHYNVADNSDGFREFLKLKQIEFMPNGSFTTLLLGEEDDVFEIGYRFALYKKELQSQPKN